MQDNLDFTLPPADLGEAKPLQKVGRSKVAAMAGTWMINKYQDQARIAETTRQAAKNLRKQGVPLDIALAILAGVKPR